MPDVLENFPQNEVSAENVRKALRSEQLFSLATFLAGALFAAACMFGYVKIGSGLVRDVKPFVEEAMTAETINEMVSHIATVQANLERRGLADGRSTKEVGQALERLETLRDVAPEEGGVFLDIARFVVRDMSTHDIVGWRYWYLRLPLFLCFTVGAAVFVFFLLKFIGAGTYGKALLLLALKNVKGAFLHTVSVNFEK